jgi:hypothetical protein
VIMSLITPVASCLMVKIILWGHRGWV